MNKYIEALVNEQQLLQLALHCAATSEDPEGQICKTADAIIVGYIVSRKVDEDGNMTFSDQSIQEEYGKMITDYCLTKMAHDGTVDVQLNENGEFCYSMTELGESLIEEEQRRRGNN